MGMPKFLASQGRDLKGWWNWEKLTPFQLHLTALVMPIRVHPKTRISEPSPVGLASSDHICSAARLGEETIRGGASFAVEETGATVHVTTTPQRKRWCQSALLMMDC